VAIAADESSKATEKSMRAVFKDVFCICGDILVDIRLGCFDPEEAKRIVDGFDF